MNTDKKPERDGNVQDGADMIVFKTPSSTYRFTPSWTENVGLKDILVGLIADDLNDTNK